MSRWLTLIALGTAPTLGQVSDSPSEHAIQRVLADEAKRIETIARVAPAVVSIFTESRSGGGSGVLIDEQGYGLTNYHVVGGMMGTRRGLGGLSDGHLYELEVLGIDVTGDVAMFRLVGKSEFPHAQLGDSDTVAVGDTIIAMGNPFTLAEDYTPTITTGIVSGVHRYQGEGETLVYSDCIQVDASINPGNSGGPLFDSNGSIIGINGRISAEMHKYARGRFNVGLGYAISINQIKRFMPTLRAGLLGRHGTLAATVIDDVDRVIFNEIYEDSPAWNVGVRIGDQLLRFGGVEIDSANRFLSVLGTYPENWPVPVSFESNGRVRHKVVRLEPVDPPMKRPFRPSDDLNREAMERVLQAVRAVICGSERTHLPKATSYGIRREYANGRITEYRARIKSSGKSLREELGRDGAIRRRIEYDIGSAEYVEGDRRYDVGTEDELLYRTLAELRKLLRASAASADDETLEYVGADAIVDIDQHGRVVRARLLESLRLSPDEQTNIRFGFELDSHMPARATARDLPSERGIEIVFGDYRTIDGFHWPHEMTVTMPASAFTERVSNLKVQW